MRAATVVAGALVAAAAGMAALAFAGGDDQEQAAAPTATPVAAATSTPAPASGGLAVWAANGCGGCHTFAPANAKGMFGPDLALSLQGADTAYIRQSIVDPDAVAAPSWEVGAMPTDFAERIPPADLAKLIAFIERGVNR